MRNGDPVGQAPWPAPADPAGRRGRPATRGVAKITAILSFLQDAALAALINARAALSADMAIRVQKAFGPDMETLMRMQNSWDIAEARKREPAIKVRRYVAKGARAA